MGDRGSAGSGIDKKLKQRPLCQTQLAWVWWLILGVPGLRREGKEDQKFKVSLRSPWAAGDPASHKDSKTIQ